MYGKLTSKIKKLGSGAVQMTNRAKWVFHPFGFLKGHILQKADVVHTAAFSTSTASATRIPDKSRGSSIGTDMENMDPSIQALSQPSFSAATNFYASSVARHMFLQTIPADSEPAL